MVKKQSRLWLSLAVVALIWAGPASAARKPPLYAAAGKIDITPDLSHETTWLAGYGAFGRRAKGVHDPLYARALVLSDGSKTVALVAVDSIGLFREQVEEIRRDLGWSGGKEYLFLSAIHDHSAPDTMGLWGRFLGLSGVDKRYQRRLRDSVVRLVRDLSGSLKEAELSAGRMDLDPRGLCQDSRDPVVIDPELDVMRVRAKGAKRAIGTLVRWSCHPEVLGSDNLLVTADYPGALCARVEEKEGGTCVFQSGVIGGLLTPETDRAPGLEHEFAEARRIGQSVADAALAAPHGGWLSSARVSFASRVVRVPVENSRYLLFLPNLVFGHRILSHEGKPLPRRSTYWLALRHLLLFPLPERLRPWVETEVSHVSVGPVEFLGIPGELFPELAIGGYDGRYRFGHPLIRPTNPNPPQLANAPAGPYLRDKLKSKVGILVGLANDELGYIIPDYDFQATPNRAMAPRPPGTHYEETNSIGPSATGILLQAFDELLKP